MPDTLVHILGDQLTHALPSLAGCDPADTIVLLAEVWDECTYVRHHQQKIVLVLSAMRHFAAELRDAGWRVDYVELEAQGNTGNLTGELERAIARHRPARLRIVEAGEWRVREIVAGWQDRFGLVVEILADTRFVCSEAAFLGWAQGKRQLVMEGFYRLMRRRTGLLMDGAEPAGGQWNYDHDNRAAPSRAMNPPATPRFAADAVTRTVIALVARRFGTHFGRLEPFGWPVTAGQAREALRVFVNQRLPDFGTWQDAMVDGSDDLFHSLLSTSINLGLLDPLECCHAAERAWRDGHAPLHCVEGFIRQIIGWREYIRGMYWLEMPALAQANALAASRPLPEFYWTGETDMRCLADCVRSTRDNAHAHHIQRLMVLGNFALIAGIVPQEVEDWFLVVYADAYEWVELPNVAAMALWADQGKLASKPYAASGNYINKMSNYCGKCRYNVAIKTGPDACPFNPLYWHFLVRNRRLLERNQRIARAYTTWDRMSEDKRAAYLGTAEMVLASLEPAAPGWARPADLTPRGS